MRAGIVSSWNEPCLLLDPISHLLSKRQPNKKVDCIPVGAEIVISVFEGKTGRSRVSNLGYEMEKESGRVGRRSRKQRPDRRC